MTLQGPSGDVTDTAIQSPDNSNISFSSDDKEDGTFVAGADAAAFDGAWYADLDFFLPANATNVTLSFNNLTVDDRVVLELNGVIIGDAGFGGTTDSKGRMAFNLDAPLTETDFDFDGANSGTVTTGFTLGGENDLRLIVNNTNQGADLKAAAAGFQTSGDATLVGLNATVSFSAVPEPATFILFGAARAFWSLRKDQAASGNLASVAGGTPATPSVAPSQTPA